MKTRNIRYGSLSLIAGIMAANSSFAAPVLPGPADIDRVKPDQRMVAPPRNDESIVQIPEQSASPGAPEAAKKIHFMLKHIKVEGVTVFTADDFASIYQPYLNKDVTLDVAWQMAAQITALYHDKGYFLSRAYVPAQEISSGTIVIKVVEGYVGEINIDPAAQSHLTDNIAEQIKAEKPIKIQDLESQLLFLNDIPGYTFQATAEPIHEGEEGAVRLTIAAKSKGLQGSVSADNYGSRFLGPYELNLGVSGSILPNQLTSVNGLVSLPTDELKSVSGSHKIYLLQDLSVELFGGYSTANPGYNLEDKDVKSKSISEGISFAYQAIRQRQENLAFKLTIDGRDTTTDILGAPITRDRVRAARVNASYDRGDDWAGYNYLTFTVSHGIDGIGATQEDDRDISRSGATPDFSKEEFTYTRLQGVTEDVSAILGLAGQYSSQSLYSSEEFGYGGQAFGRAYDISEISGDSGIDASLEVRYQGIPQAADISFIPYGFYDIGRVWNNNPGQVDKISGSSAGLGLRLQHSSGINANLGVALPLTKAADTPLYGGNGKTPRYTFQVGYSF